MRFLLLLLCLSLCGGAEEDAQLTALTQIPVSFRCTLVATHFQKRVGGFPPLDSMEGYKRFATDVAFHIRTNEIVCPGASFTPEGITLVRRKGFFDKIILQEGDSGDLIIITRLALPIEGTDDTYRCMVFYQAKDRTYTAMLCRPATAAEAE